jgi:hypothetical protein
MPTQNRVIEDMLTSMLRSDYIPLGDTKRLGKLKQYYVDYMGYLNQVLGDTDQLIVGRRGTGKTTLLYRSLVECMESWTDKPNLANKNTLGIYIDISKCQSLIERSDKDFQNFEVSFATELCRAIGTEINRSWPQAEQNNLLGRLFRSAEERKRREVQHLIADLAKVLRTGIPTVTQFTSDTHIKATNKNKTKVGADAKFSAGIDDLSVSLGASTEQVNEAEHEQEWSEKTEYRLNISDIINLIGEIRQKASISSIYIFIDEFSSLPEILQRRFTTLLKKMLGNQRGIYIKLSVITDYYTLGSSIILQRDLFELPLDLDALVERSDSLNAAMSGLADFTERLIEQRLAAYTNLRPQNLLDDPARAYRELSRAAMGVPRTLGLALQNAWHRAQSSARHRISPADIEYGIRSASRGYLNQLLGASKGGLAMPAYARDIWEELIGRAISERTKGKRDASHFMVLPKHQQKLRLLNMFFVVHLLTDGRTTKKEKLSRSLYCFDYGQCIENNLGYATDKNVIRQQRFAYDAVLSRFDSYFGETEAKTFSCPKCGTTYTEDDLDVGGTLLSFCPKDKVDLEVYQVPRDGSSYTEEEIKIIGAIRSSDETDAKIARAIADDVGCYSQKVGKFGEKLDRDGVIARKRLAGSPRYFYFSKD